MSNRNQHTNTYSKMSPMPSTASQIEEIRNAVIRRNKYKGSPDFEDANNRKNKTNNDTVYKEPRRHSDTNEFVSKGKIKQINISDLQQYRGCVSYENVRQSDVTSRRNDNRSGCSVTSEKSRTDTSPEVVKSFSRPKSARPESRWQRRVEDLGDEDDELPVFYSDSDSDDKSSKSDERPMSERPMSARPDSRLARHQATVVNQSNVKPIHHVNHTANQSTDLPPRPKTSHGRHTPETITYKENLRSNPESKQKATSKNTNRDGWKFDPNEKWQRHEQSQDSNNYKTNMNKTVEPKMTLHEANVYSLTDNNRVQNADRAHATNQTFVSNKFSLSAIDKKLFGPGDDIDLDVDPVEFFYTPDTTEQPPSSHKSSLSKGVINLINDSSSDGVQYRSNHGNNQTKRTINPDANDRFHGNSVYSPKTVMGNQSSSSTVQARRTVESINTRSNQIREGGGGSLKKKVPPNPESRVVSLNTGERIHMEFPFKNGQKKKDTRITAISRQQQRKLKPISTLQNGIE